MHDMRHRQMSVELGDFLVGKGLVSENRHGSLCLESLEDALREWTLDSGCSKKALKQDVRELGLNLRSGQMFGSPERLTLAIQTNEAPTVRKTLVKRFPLVKKCLVDLDRF